MKYLMGVSHSDERNALQEQQVGGLIPPTSIVTYLQQPTEH